MPRIVSIAEIPGLQLETEYGDILRGEIYFGPIYSYCTVAKVSADSVIALVFTSGPIGVAGGGFVIMGVDEFRENHPYRVMVDESFAARLRSLS